nr:DCC1-like thiol-disulfide oxidoreductase family protein [uncultured Actinotalea sp.]
MGDRVDAWIHGGAFTRTSLARYRIVYSVIVLLTLPDFSWVAAFPDSLYKPPIGPFMLADGFPPEGLLQGLEAIVAICFVAMLLGWHTRTASFLAVVASIVGFGFTYSLGKIDHDILIVIVPAFMALAGWGDRLSLDAVRRRGAGRPEAPEAAEHWPLRMFALVVGLAFITAALPKIRGGWLDPTSQAIQGRQLRHYYTSGADGQLAGLVLEITDPVVWELLDIATILLEAGMILAVLSWAGTRFGFAVASLFHLGVWLVMDIAFYMNVVAYGFVVTWDRWPRTRPAARTAPGWLVRGAPVVVLLGGFLWSQVLAVTGNAAPVVYPVVLVAGAVVGAGFLGAGAVRWLRRARTDARGGVLVYDADCGFCTRSATWLAGRGAGRVELAAWQAVPDLAQLGLTADDVARRAYWRAQDGDLRGGAAAIASAMIARGGLARWAGVAIGSPLVVPLAALVYGRVARHRHVMPGSTDACRLPPSGVLGGDAVAGGRETSDGPDESRRRPAARTRRGDRER